jgi:hypothetical protein
MYWLCMYLLYLFIYQKHNSMSNLKTVGNKHVSTEKTQVAPSLNKNHAIKTYGDWRYSSKRALDGMVSFNPRLL